MTDEMKKNEETRQEPDGDQTAAREVTFADIEPASQEYNNPQNIDFLLDIPLGVTVELGRTRIKMGDLLKLGQGSVVELDKLTDQPLEILINNKLMAEGEVVVINEKFGIRLTNIISPGDIVKELT